MITTMLIALSLNILKPFIIWSEFIAIATICLQTNLNSYIKKWLHSRTTLCSACLLQTTDMKMRQWGSPAGVALAIDTDNHHGNLIDLTKIQIVNIKIL